MANGNDEKTVEVHLKEYEFVSSLIPMYRRFQMQAVNFSLLVYTALVSLVGAIWDKDHQKVLQIALPALPWLISAFLLSFVMMEVRIERASRYLDKTLGDWVRTILNEENLLQWETAPGVHLNFFKKLFSSSLPLILALSAPALLASGFYFFCYPKQPLLPQWFLGIGLLLLLVSALTASLISIINELRTKEPTAKASPNK